VLGRFPDPGRHDDRGIDADDVVALLNVDPPPGVLQVPLQLDPKRPVVPETAEAAINLAAGENEAAPLAQGNECFQVYHWITKTYLSSPTLITEKTVAWKPDSAL